MARLGLADVSRGLAPGRLCDLHKALSLSGPRFPRVRAEPKPGSVNGFNRVVGVNPRTVHTVAVCRCWGRAHDAPEIKGARSVRSPLPDCGFPTLPACRCSTRGLVPPHTQRGLTFS